MVDFHPASTTSRQAQALMWALQRHEGEAADLLRWHPRRESLEAALSEPTRPIDELLWEELMELELEAGVRPGDASPQNRHPLRYWRRRYRVATTEEHNALLDRLPDLWHRLLTMPDQDVESLATLTGMELIAHAVAAGDADQTVALLKTLDRMQAFQVRSRAAELGDARLPDEAIAPWRSVFAKRAAKRPGSRMARWLGFSTLATLYSMLPPSLRSAATRHGRTNLFRVLQRGRAMWTLTAEAGAATESAVFAQLGALPGGGMAAAPQPAAEEDDDD